MLTLMRSLTPETLALIAVLWLGSGLVGMLLLVVKGYAGLIVADIGCLVFLAVGWFAIPVLLALGPVWLFLSVVLDGVTVCPGCRMHISARAQVCGRCWHARVPQ